MHKKQAFIFYTTLFLMYNFYLSKIREFYFCADKNMIISVLQIFCDQ